MRRSGTGSADTVAGDSVSLHQALGLMARLLQLIRPYWGSLARAFALSAVTSLVGLIGPYLTKLIFDEVYPSQDVELLTVLVAGIAGLGLAGLTISSIQAYYSLVVNTRLRNAVNQYFFNHVQHLPLRFFEHHQTGEILSRFTDIGRSLGTANRAFEILFVQGLYIVLVPPVLFVVQWKLAIVALVSVPITTLAIAVSGKALRRIWKRSSEAYAEVGALHTEALSQIKTVKSLGIERLMFTRLQGQVISAMRTEIDAGALGQLVSMASGLLRTLNTALMTWLGWRYILSGNMTLGDYMAFTAYVGFLNRPLSSILDFFSEFQRSAVSLQRMYEYLDMEPEQDPSACLRPATPARRRLRGAIELRDVHFSYGPEKHALKGVSLRIRAGTSLAIVGPSGSGKTTLLRLLAAFDAADAGEILLDGEPIAAIPLADLRQQTGIVLQEHGLVRGTVWDNLTLGLEAVDESVVLWAAEVARVDRFAAELPGGYSSPVAEWGSTLSGGQRQRLAIARALARQAPIILMDEPTSNLDVATEAAILERVLGPEVRATVVIVTHRLASAQRADHICVLVDGRVAGLGTHNELLRTCAEYRSLLDGEGSKFRTDDRARRALGRRALEAEAAERRASNTLPGPWT